MEMLHHRSADKHSKDHGTVTGRYAPPVDARDPVGTGERPRAPAARPARLSDVARRAGVSVKTVSNVVNGYLHVSPATRAKVDRALTELDYRPNLAARNLRQGRSGIVALAVPDLEVPYFAELAVHLVRAARARGWTVLIDQTDGEQEREQLAIENFGTQLVDGLILSPIASGVPELAARRATTPMVLLGERVYDGPDDHVSIDNVAAAATAVRHLLEIGRRRVAAVGQQSVVSAETARLRVNGYREALSAAGLPLDPDLVVATESFTREQGAAAVDRLLGLAQPPDALFCFNDLLALGALRRLHERGRRVPAEVAVVGMDDIEDGRFSVPTLTTIRPDKERIAELAVELLAERIAAERSGDVPGPGAGREVQAPYELVVRESTAG
jgi:DNA-binding LacI/PurR family transcriptional regulator